MALPRFLTRRPAQLLALLLALATVAALSRLGDDRSPAGAVRPDAGAVLMVDDVGYEFRLDTCFIGNDSFVVAGYGSRDGEDFRVLASPSEVELAFGITDQSAPVPENSLWLATTDAVGWSTDGSEVTASVQLVDRHGDGSVAHEAQLRANCGTTP